VAVATAPQIALLEQMAGPLPGAYVRWLRHWDPERSRHPGEVRLIPVMKVWSAYDVQRWLGKPPFARFLLFAQDGSGNGYDYFLDREEVVDDDDCMVVRMSTEPSFDPEKRERLDIGFAQFLAELR
jgi:hypothetical protein